MPLLKHDLLKKNPKDSKFKISPSLHAFVLENHDKTKSHENSDDGQLAAVDDLLSNFCKQAEYRWNRADYSMPSFEKKYRPTDWLAEQVSIPAPHNQGKSKAQEGANPSPLGRPSKE